MFSMRSGLLALAACAVVALGCAAPDAGGGRAEPLGSPSPTPSDTAPAADPAPGDVAPHEAENNGWRYRRDPSPAELRIATAAANRLRPALERLRKAGDYSPESTRRVILSQGHPASSVEVQAFTKPSWWTSPAPPQGVVFAIHVGSRACVDGDIRPERVLVQVEGSAAEFGCLEPSTH